jgi:uncharacterized membrane protein YdjX (TVP38/TMEM64 family)
VTLTKTQKFGGLALLVLASVLAVVLLPVDRWLLALVEWIRSAGALGVASYAFAYIAATLLLLPGSVLTLGAGFAYGPLWGTLLVSPVSVAAATAAFVLGRSLLRARVSRRVAKYPRFAAIDKAVGDSGFKIVLLLRLSPVFPFNFLNYALGLTRVSLRSYVLASFIGMLPATFLFVYLGSLITNASQLTTGTERGGVWGQLLYWGGLAATLIATLFIARVAKKALARAVQEGNSERAERPGETNS